MTKFRRFCFQKHERKRRESDASWSKKIWKRSMSERAAPKSLPIWFLNRQKSETVHLFFTHNMNIPWPLFSTVKNYFYILSGNGASFQLGAERNLLTGNFRMTLTYAEGRADPTVFFLDSKMSSMKIIGLEKKVDLRRINLDALKPWIADKIARLVADEVISVQYSLPEKLAFISYYNFKIRTPVKFRPMSPLIFVTSNWVWRTFSIMERKCRFGRYSLYVP